MVPPYRSSTVSFTPVITTVQVPSLSRERVGNSTTAHVQTKLKTTKRRSVTTTDEEIVPSLFFQRSNLDQSSFIYLYSFIHSLKDCKIDET
jgi:sulfur carrier protein ThiS